MIERNGKDNQGILTGFVAHYLKNALAEISAEACRLRDNETLLLAVHRLSRIISDTLYLEQLQGHILPPPPAEEIAGSELLELLRIRLQPEIDARNASLSLSMEPDVSLITNLDFSLEAFERLALVTLNWIVPDRPLKVTASKPPCRITVGPFLARPQAPLWPDPAYLDTLSEQDRLSFLVARELLAFLGCRLETEPGDSAGQRCWLISFTGEFNSQRRRTDG